MLIQTTQCCQSYILATVYPPSKNIFDSSGTKALEMWSLTPQQPNQPTSWAKSDRKDSAYIFAF